MASSKGSIFFKRRIVPILLGLLGLLIGVVLAVRPPVFVSKALTRLDYLIYDLRINTTLKKNPNTHNIVIVDIDEKSLKKEGRWPWPRSKVAELVAKLRENNVIVIALDMVFAEPQQNPGDAVVSHLNNVGADKQVVNTVKKHASALDQDQRLASSIKKHEVILGFILHNNKQHAKGSLPAPLMVLDFKRDAHKRLTVNSFVAHTGNIKLLQDSAKFGGAITTVRDSDGMIRRTPLVMRYGNKLYPSLALKAVEQYLLADNIDVDIKKMGQQYSIEYISLGKLKIPTDKAGQVVIPYLGKRKTFPTISATDVLHDMLTETQEKQLEGSVAFVGTSALGLGELQVTPVDRAFPGVELHATIAAGILQNRFPVQPPWAKGAELVVLVATGLVLAFLIPFLSPAWSVVLLAIVVGVLVGGDYWMWVAHGLFIPVSLIFLVVIFQGVSNFVYGFAVQRRQALGMKNLFGQYVPPQRVQDMYQSLETYDMQGESRVMSVLFADICGFTSLSEKMSATDLRVLLNDFFTPMTQIIFDTQGTIDKYVGDMIMAFWSAPVSDDEHAKHAVNAALAMLEKTEELQADFEKKQLPAVHVGIGINTGPMNVGDMGSQFRRSYTVIGDAVNLGSRLEALTRFYGVDLLVSEDTQLLCDHVVWRCVDNIRVKGKEAPVKVFAPLGQVDGVPQALLDEEQQFQQAYTAYCQQNWTQAITLFEQLKQQSPDTALYGIYLERIASLRDTDLPADWAGVFTHTHK